MSTIQLRTPNLNKRGVSWQQVRQVISRLQWRLTLSYTLFTAVTALGLALVSLVLLWYNTFWSNWIPARTAGDLLKMGAQVSTYLETRPPDQAGLNNWLQEMIVGSNLVVKMPAETDASSGRPPFPLRFERVISLAIVNTAGEVVAGYPAETFKPGERLPDQLTPEARAGFQVALQGETDPDELSTRTAARHILAAAPIFGTNNQFVGAIFIETDSPVEERDFFRFVLRQAILPVVLMMLVVGVVAGVLFGYFIARDLTRRLHAVAGAADAWSQGNFDVLVPDDSADELGQLAHRLNQMALQLQTLLQTRQGLATLEERNRLARDLHDSVKQQVFATAMQVSAALTLFDENPAAAKKCLLETDKLIGQAQQELTGLIQELRPAALEDKGLTTALREYVNDWSRRNNIAAEVRVRGEQAMAIVVEQTLFRVTQEALANIARHSGATDVKVYLAWAGDQVTLTVSDNGHGFNPATTNGKGLGLRSMRERVETIGGDFSITSQPGAGTQVTVQCDKLLKI